ncbi:MAG: HAD family hydrolase [bacterium]|nr:HAD family hydrolase [bacterium]
MEKNKIKILSFDLDDTLYDERDFIKSGFSTVAAHMQKSHGADAERFCQGLQDILIKYGRGKIFDRILQEYNMYSPELVKELVDVYRSHAPTLSLREGAGSFLEYIKKNYKLALITDGIASVQKNKVRALGIGKFFDLLVYTDELGVSKPDVKVFERVMSFFSAPPDQALYVGDNPHKDFIGAKKIGMSTARIMRGVYKDVVLGEEYEADFRVRNLVELQDMLEEKT